jgi:GTP cyclohydrolase I
VHLVNGCGDAGDEEMDKQKIEKAVRLILEGIGEDIERQDLKGTPKRVAQMYEEVFSGLSKDPAKEISVFLAVGHDEIILIKDIPIYSICEHHLLPFTGKASIGYVPDGNRVTGLSKIARVVEILSKRPQVQERLTTGIADVLMERLKPKGVIVVIEAEHLCMSMRGVKKPGAITVTSAVRGIFRTNHKTRAEALSLMRRNGG